jgi:type VI secretion system secreted protein Hcp
MAIYVKYGSIKGNSTHQEHKDWLDISSMQFGVGRAISTPVGSTQNREASEPSVSEINLTKLMDESSVDLFQESCTSHDGKDCTIHLVSTGSPGRTYAEYKLTNALVSSYSMSTGGDRPDETISINFTKIEFKHIAYDEKGSGTPKTSHYDLTTTKGS